MMPTPNIRSLEEMREQFGNFLQENDLGKRFDTNSIDAYGSLDCEVIENYWLSVIRERDAEYRRRIEGLRKEQMRHLKVGKDSYLWERETNAHNQAIDQALSIIPGKDE